MVQENIDALGLEVALSHFDAELMHGAVRAARRSSGVYCGGVKSAERRPLLRRQTRPGDVVSGKVSSTLYLMALECMTVVASVVILLPSPRRR